MLYKKVISKLVHYYLNDQCFVTLCNLAIQKRSLQILCYCGSKFFREIKTQYCDLQISYLALDSFLEGIRSDVIELPNHIISFYEAGVEVRKLKEK